MSDVQTEVKAKKATLVIKHEEGKVARLAYKFAHGAEHEVTLSPEHPLYHDLAVHGLKQILGDSISTKKTSEEGEQNFARRVEAFENGEWAVKGGGESAPTGGLLAKALANLSGQELSYVQNYLSNLGMNEATGEVDEKERTTIHAALRKDPDVAAEIERIRPPKKERKVSDEAAKKAANVLAGLLG